MRCFLILLTILMTVFCACMPNQNVQSADGDQNLTVNSFNRTIGSNSGRNIDPSNKASEIKPSSSYCLADFKNFTYDWFPGYYSQFVNQKKVTLVGGESGTQTTSKENLLYEASLANVSCLDLTGDEKDEAIVTVEVSFSNKARPKRIFVFGEENKKIKLLWHYDTGTEERGLRGLYKVGDSLVVEEYDNKHGEPTPAFCCPQRFIRSSFSWEENHFRKSNVEFLPYSKNYREFVGYPRP